MCVSNRIEQFSASYFRSGSAPQAPIEACPKCGRERLSFLCRCDSPLERAHLRALNGGGLGLRLGLGLGGDGGDGRHDRLPLSAQSKGDFRPRKL